MNLLHTMKNYAEQVHNRIAVLSGNGWGELALVSLVVILLGAMTLPTLAIIDSIFMRVIAGLDRG